MKLRKTAAMILVIFMALTVFGCGSSSGKTDGNSGQGGQSASDHYPVTISTYNYAKEPIEVTFDKCPERVICTNQTQTELMLYFGLDEYIVGTAYLDGAVRADLKAQYDALVAAGKELTVKGYPSKEVVLALEPDFIFGWRSAFAENALGDVTEWNEKGVGTMILRCSNNTAEKRDIEAVLADIADIGAIFNIEDKTDAYIQQAREMMERIEKKVAEQEKPFTAIIIEPYDGTFYCWGSNTLTGALVVAAGAEYALPDGGDLTVEDIVNLNPDVIIIDYMEEEGLTTDECETKALETIVGQAALAEVSAVANGKVMAVNLTDVYGGGVRMVPSVELMFQFMYGD
ncbi:MAG: ABC transporter substrate-binding protein [Eubacteriaceae bacterium]|nr:ABC transporter substrate-binding protein [Eubacteriaceae bacterium]